MIDKTKEDGTTISKRAVGFKVFVETFKVAIENINDKNKLKNKIESLTFFNKKGVESFYTENSIKAQMSAIYKIFRDGEEWNILKEISCSDRVDKDIRTQASSLLKLYKKI